MSARAAAITNLYLANENHTDYGWNDTTANYDSSMNSELSYYLAQIAATSGNPPETQARFVMDGWYYLYHYKQTHTAGEFQTLVNRIVDGHLTVPLNPLVDLYGAMPTEAAIRAGSWPGRIARQYGISFEHAEESENTTIPWGMATIWGSSGVKYSWKGICACAATGNAWQQHATNVFRWRGPDDTDLLMKWYVYSGNNQSWGGYSENRSAMDAGNPSTAMQAALTHFASVTPGLPVGLFGYGWDDVNSQITKIGTNATNWNDAHVGGDHAHVSNIIDFFTELEGQRNSLPVIRGGWGNDWDLWPSTLAEHTAVTRRAVERLRTAEALAAIVHLSTPSWWTTRQAALEAAWVDYFKYFEHVWGNGGVGLPYIVNNKITWSDNFATTVSQVDTAASVAFAALFTTPGSEDRFVVFNPLVGAARTDYADLDGTWSGAYTVTDLAAGTQVPNQVLAGGTTLRILASNVPSLGYRVYRVAAGAGQSFSNAATVTPGSGLIESTRWQVTVGTGGQLTSVIDKANGNRHLERSGQSLNTYGSGTSGSYLAENVGPVSATMLRTVTGTPTRSVRVTLFAPGVDRIELDNRVSSNISGIHGYTFTTNFTTPAVRFEEVGAIAEPGPIAQGGDFAPGARPDWQTLNHFIDLNNGAYGMTLSSLDSSWVQIGNATDSSWDLSNTHIVKPMLTGTFTGSDITNQNNETSFRTQLALTGNAGAYSGPRAMRDALAHQNPLRAIALARTQSGGITANTGSYLSVDQPNVIVTAVKPSEEGTRGIIARVWELAGAASTDFTLDASSMAPAAAYTTTLIESDLGAAALNGGVLSASIGANQWKSFRLAQADGVTPAPTVTATTPTSTPAIAATTTATIPATPTSTQTAPRTPTTSVTQTPSHTVASTSTATATPTQSTPPAVTLTPTVTPTATPTATPSPTPSILTIWGPAATPGTAASTDPAAAELGVKFTADVNGLIRGIRFYKGTTNTGTHTGTLWSSAGAPLATATFTNETASGWQQVNFATPVAIMAGTVYVASYHTNVGRYAFDAGYFAAAGIDNPPLHALRNGVSGANGVYVYGASAFPTDTYQSSNYWVDVAFSAGQAVTATVTQTATPAGTATATPSRSATATTTATPSVTATATPADTASATPVATATAVATATETATPLSTATPTLTTAPTVTATTTATATATPTVTPTATPSPNPFLAPAAPTDLTATGSVSGVALAWTANSEPDLAGYNVYRSASAGGPFIRLNASLLTSPAYDDTSAPGTSDFYRVTALNTSALESAPSATASATLPVANRIANPGFELDANGDTRPDSWTTNANVTRSSAVVRSESSAMRHVATTGASYRISQTRTGLAAATTYTFGGWVNIPATSDTFTFTLRIRWRNSANKVLRTDSIKVYNAATDGWNKATASLVSPTGTEKAVVDMVVTSLSATIYVDDVALR